MQHKYDYARVKPHFNLLLLAGVIPSLIFAAIIGFNLSIPYGLLFIIYFLVIHFFQLKLEYMDEKWFKKPTQVVRTQSDTQISELITNFYYNTFNSDGHS
jgi:hypothetical protein